MPCLRASGRLRGPRWLPGNRSCAPLRRHRAASCRGPAAQRRGAPDRPRRPSRRAARRACLVSASRMSASCFPMRAMSASEPGSPSLSISPEAVTQIALPCVTSSACVRRFGPPPPPQPAARMASRPTSEDEAQAHALTLADAAAAARQAGTVWGDGAIAQLGERRAGSAEVSGSSPLSSIASLPELQRLACSALTSTVRSLGS